MNTRNLKVDNLRVLINPYGELKHARAIFGILDSYARDTNGGGKALPDRTRTHLVPELRKRPWMVTFLALLGEEPAGLLIAVEGFSTFAARPLMNIHDVAVLPEHRGKGIGGALFAEVEALARKKGCCKLTLEVLNGNEGAKSLYSRLGYKPYVLDPELGAAEFWEKSIDT